VVTLQCSMREGGVLKLASAYIFLRRRTKCTFAAWSLCRVGSALQASLPPQHQPLASPFFASAFSTSPVKSPSRLHWYIAFYVRLLLKSTFRANGLSAAPIFRALFGLCDISDAARSSLITSSVKEYCTLTPCYRICIRYIFGR